MTPEPLLALNALGGAFSCRGMGDFLKKGPPGLDTRRSSATLSVASKVAQCDTNR